MPSETDLRKRLLDILNAYKRVELGSVGKLILQYKEAQIHEGKILPPHDVIGFSRVLDEEEEGVFAKALSDGLISPEDHQQLTAYVDEKLAQLNLVGAVSLFDLGELSSRDAVVEWTTEYTDQTLPIISLPQIIQTSDQSNVTTESIDVVKKPIETKVERESKSSNTSYIWPISIIGIGLITMILMVRACTTGEKAPNNNLQKQDILEVAADDIAPFEKIDSGRLFTHPHLDKYKEVLTSEVIQEGCKIVVGSFKDEANALRMEERVLTEGYNTLIEQDNSRSRVIIKFDCLEKDLVDFLVEVRENISPKSWYLLPHFEPEL